MKKLKNSNIISIINGGNGMIKLLNKIIKNNVFYIINEYEPKGELFSYITSYEKGFGEEISKILFYQILSGLNYITNNGFFIEKIKLDNLLLDNNYIIKISDFFLENINNKSNFNIIDVNNIQKNKNKKIIELEENHFKAVLYTQEIKKLKKNLN
jgi:serine/threonine protein kinase